MKTRKKKYSVSFIIGFLLVIVGLFTLSYEYFMKKKLEAFDKMNIALFESEMPEVVVSDDNIVDSDDISIEEQEPSDEIPNNNDSNEQTKPKPSIDYSKYYVGTLEIPKINLTKGFLDINSPYNNVDKNVTVIRTSTYPDVDKGNFILAAHTGSSRVSFFNKLHNLIIGDLAYINYKQKKYTYELVDIYTQPKTGMISIYRDTNKTTLTLVTCTPGQETQTIFILELINME